MCFDTIWALISKSDFRGFGNYETCIFFAEMHTLMYLCSLGQVKDVSQRESTGSSLVVSLMGGQKFILSSSQLLVLHKEGQR